MQLEDWPSPSGIVIGITQEKTLLSSCSHQQRLIRLFLGTFQTNNPPQNTMCYQEDVYHSQCRHWGKRVYSKCANTTDRKWADGCWERITTGSVRVDDKCSGCCSGRANLTAGTWPASVVARSEKLPAKVQAQSTVLDRAQGRRITETEFLGNRFLHM